MADEAGMLIKDRLTGEFGDGIRQGSMIFYEEIITGLLALIRPRVLLEIGTFYGCSSALFARHCEEVITIEIKKFAAVNAPKAEKVWDFLGVRDRVRYYLAANNGDKKRFIEKAGFDMAFVDGSHKAGEVKFDFNCVRKCGCVLFHDYKPKGGIYRGCTNERYPGIARFIGSLRPAPFVFGQRCSQFALWMGENHALRNDEKLMQWLRLQA